MSSQASQKVLGLQKKRKANSGKSQKRRDREKIRLDITIMRMALAHERQSRGAETFCKHCTCRTIVGDLPE